MKSLNFTIKILFLTLILIIIIEILSRSLLFIFTNKDVFKYGFKKSVTFEIVDLSKFQVTIVDKDRNLKKYASSDTENIWIFGGSTTAGYNCEAGQSSSWSDEIYNLNKKFTHKNFAFNGSKSNQQISLFWREIILNQPKIILWAIEFYPENIVGKKNINKTKFIIFIKRLDKTLKSYLISYSLLDKIIDRINVSLNNQSLVIQPSKPSDEDINFALNNFEKDTKEIIEISKKYGVKEFFIISLFGKQDLSKNNLYKLKLYEKVIRNLEVNYKPYVRIIEEKPVLEKKEEKLLFCDDLHKTLGGEKLQARLIYKNLILLSDIFNE